jgi:hypothetical protein
MYKVFHRQPLYPGLITGDPEPLPAATLDWPVSYQEVARVEASSLEEVYFKTQHLESPWWHNRGVQALQISRSTSVGDVIQEDQALRESQAMRDEQGNLWAVATIGFVRLADEEVKPGSI